MLLSARGLAKSFGEARVLDDVDLEVARGQHTLIFGPSGSGKSTLLNLIATLLAPDRGELRFDGTPYEELGDPRAFRLRYIGLMFQDFHLLESLTVAQNVEMVQMARGGDGLLSLRELLEPLGLGERMRSPVKILSRGERQRVALARAFANRPSLVLGDEPTASLDPSNRGRTLDHLFGLCERTGATAIVVSHDHAIASRPEFAQVLELDRGRAVVRPIAAAQPSSETVPVG